MAYSFQYLQKPSRVIVRKGKESSYITNILYLRSEEFYSIRNKPNNPNYLFSLELADAASGTASSCTLVMWAFAPASLGPVGPAEADRSPLPRLLPVIALESA